MLVSPVCFLGLRHDLDLTPPLRKAFELILPAAAVYKQEAETEALLTVSRPKHSIYVASVILTD